MIRDHQDNEQHQLAFDTQILATGNDYNEARNKALTEFEYNQTLPNEPYCKGAPTRISMQFEDVLYAELTEEEFKIVAMAHCYTPEAIQNIIKNGSTVYVEAWESEQDIPIKQYGCYGIVPDPALKNSINT